MGQVVYQGGSDSLRMSSSSPTGKSGRFRSSGRHSFRRWRKCVRRASSDVNVNPRHSTGSDVAEVVRRTTSRCRPFRGRSRFGRVRSGSCRLAQPCVPPGGDRYGDQVTSGSDQSYSGGNGLVSDQPHPMSDQPRHGPTPAHGSRSRPASVRHAFRSGIAASLTTYAWSGWFGSSGRVMRISPA